MSLHMGLSCRDWFRSLLYLSHSWSGVVPRKISLHSPIFSSEVWLVASLLVSAVFPLIAVTLSLLLIYPEHMPVFYIAREEQYLLLYGAYT